MKIYSVSAFFPEVKPAHASEQMCTVHASTLAVAALRGLHLLRKRDPLKGKKITQVRLTVLMTGTVPDLKRISPSK
jgi:hypothetical protein